MVNRDVISQLKASTVAIGTWDGSTNPTTISGTGFVIDPEGYIITAAHVLQDCQKIQKYLRKEKNLKTDVTSFRYVSKGDDVDYHYNKILGAIILRLSPEENLGGEISWDVAVCEPSPSKKKSDYLKIDVNAKVNIFDEIFMCGFPGGSASLKITKNPVSVRISPLIQYGHISSLIPHDTFQKPQGIQTDIISTGGSSGSPIIDANTGNVIAIAQKVIGGTAFTPTGKGVVNTGMVYGSSYNILKGAVNIVDDLKKGKKTGTKVHTSYGILESDTRY